MLKKLTLLAMALGALVAFAVPAVAGAANLAEEEEPLAPGAKITATGGNTVKTATGLGTLECEVVTLHGEVLSVNPTVATFSEKTTEGCVDNTGSQKIPVTIDSVEATVTLDGSGAEGTVTASATFLATIAVSSPPAACDFTSSTLDGKWKNGSDVITIGGVLTSPTCGNGTLSGSFTVETSDGTPVEVVG